MEATLKRQPAPETLAKTPDTPWLTLLLTHSSLLHWYLVIIHQHHSMHNMCQAILNSQMRCRTWWGVVNFNLLIEVWITLFG